MLKRKAKKRWDPEHPDPESDDDYETYYGICATTSMFYALKYAPLAEQLGVRFVFKARTYRYQSITSPNLICKEYWMELTALILIEWEPTDPIGETYPAPLVPTQLYCPIPINPLMFKWSRIPSEFWHRYRIDHVVETSSDAWDCDGRSVTLEDSPSESEYDDGSSSSSVRSVYDDGSSSSSVRDVY